MIRTIPGTPSNHAKKYLPMIITLECVELIVGRRSRGGYRQNALSRVGDREFEEQDRSYKRRLLPLM
jgi:hypothetical protein